MSESESVNPSLGYPERVAIVAEAIKDEEKMRQCIAEIHTAMVMVHEGFTEMKTEMIRTGGPAGIVKAMMKGAFK